MNNTKILELLEQWSNTIKDGECASISKAETSDGGINGRIKRTKGQPIIFDSKTYDNQKSIQNSLCQELPQWGDLIRSQPELMDGYAWTRKDFIELYFEHFSLVIEKLTKIVNQSDTTL